MKSFLKLFTSVAALLAATTGAALADGTTLNVPEPGSLALVGLALGVAVWATRRGK